MHERSRYKRILKGFRLCAVSFFISIWDVTFIAEPCLLHDLRLLLVSHEATSRATANIGKPRPFWTANDRKRAASREICCIKNPQDYLKSGACGIILGQEMRARVFCMRSRVQYRARAIIYRKLWWLFASRTDTRARRILISNLSFSSGGRSRYFAWILITSLSFLINLYRYYDDRYLRYLRNRRASTESNLMQTPHHSNDTRRYRCRAWFRQLVRPRRLNVNSIFNVRRATSRDLRDLRMLESAKKSRIMARLIRERNLAAMWDILKSVDAESSYCLSFEANANWNRVRSTDANRERRARNALNWRALRFYEFRMQLFYYKYLCEIYFWIYNLYSSIDICLLMIVIINSTLAMYIEWQNSFYLIKLIVSKSVSCQLICLGE
jgi:hypothetical protein